MQLELGMHLLLERTYYPEQLKQEDGFVSEQLMQGNSHFLAHFPDEVTLKLLLHSLQTWFTQTLQLSGHFIHLVLVVFNSNPSLQAKQVKTLTGSH